MSGFADVIAAAMPFLATEKIDGTAGTTWVFSYDIRDDAGAVVNMTSGFTGVCQIRTRGGVLVATPAVTFPVSGRVTCTVSAATTSGLTPGNYLHELEITRTSDGATIKVVGAGRAVFNILREVVA